MKVTGLDEPSNEYFMSRNYICTFVKKTDKYCLPLHTVFSFILIRGFVYLTRKNMKSTHSINFKSSQYCVSPTFC